MVVSGSRALALGALDGNSKSISVLPGRRDQASARRGGLSQEELAFAAETHPTEISHLESGRRNSSWGTVARVAGSLGVRVSDIALLAEKLKTGGA